MNNHLGGVRNAEFCRHDARIATPRLNSRAILHVANRELVGPLRLIAHWEAAAPSCLATSRLATMVNLISVSEIEIEAAAPAEPYTRESLGQTLSFMGCKQRHAFKVSQRVFDTLALIGGPAPARVQSQLRGRFPRGQLRGAIFKGDTAFLTRSQLFAIVAWALAEYRYTKPDQMDDLAIACRRGQPPILFPCLGSNCHCLSLCFAPSRLRFGPLRCAAQGPREAIAGRRASLRNERHGQVDPRSAAGESSFRPRNNNRCKRGEKRRRAPLAAGYAI